MFNCLVQPLVAFGPDFTPTPIPTPPFSKCSFCLPGILKLFCLTTHKKLSGFVIYRGWTNNWRGKKVRPLPHHHYHWTFYFKNIYISLESYHCFLTSLHIPQASRFREAKKNVFLLCLSKGFWESLLNETMQHFTLISPLEIFLIW